VAAGAGSYFATRYIMERFSPGGRLDAALKAYLRGTREAEAQAGRPLTPEERKVLFTHYKTIVDDINRRS
jgi:hypothetical protein